MSSANFCMECGAPLKPNSEFCQKCGNRVKAVTTVPSTTVPSSGPQLQVRLPRDSTLVVDSFGPQGIFPRLLAQLVDAVIVLATGWSVALFAPCVYVLVLVFFLYFILLEGLWGATVGKRLLGLRVVRTDGSRCGLRPALVRNLLRVVDGLPFLYLVGAVMIKRSKKKQRLGDILAKTLVVTSSMR